MIDEAREILATACDAVIDAMHGAPPPTNAVN
jgi:hypothetical protein